MTSLLPTKLKKKFDGGTQYIRNMNDAFSEEVEYTNWQQIFHTTDREEAAKIAKKKFGGEQCVMRGWRMVQCKLYKLWQAMRCTHEAWRRINY